jgi:hypothetical protein
MAKPFTIVPKLYTCIVEDESSFDFESLATENGIGVIIRVTNELRPKTIIPASSSVLLRHILSFTRARVRLTEEEKSVVQEDEIQKTDQDRINLFYEMLTYAAEVVKSPLESKVLLYSTGKEHDRVGAILAAFLIGFSNKRRTPIKAIKRVNKRTKKNTGQEFLINEEYKQLLRGYDEFLEKKHNIPKLEKGPTKRARPSPIEPSPDKKQAKKKDDEEDVVEALLGISGAVLICSGCKSKTYSSKSEQIQDWENHKKDCKDICFVCDTETTLGCEDCKLIHYCTKEHLNMDYARHKTECRKTA